MQFEKKQFPSFHESKKKKKKMYGAKEGQDEERAPLGLHDLEDQLKEEKEEDGHMRSQFTAQLQGISIIGILVNVFLYLFFVLLPILTSFISVHPQQHVLVIFWGRLVRVYKTPGIKIFPVFFRSTKAIPTSVQTLDIKKTTVVDRNGNPIVVAGVVTFQVVDSIRAAFDVIDYSHYIERQSLAVLKRVCSLYPYECKTGKSLQSESKEVSRLMVQLLQSKAEVAGLKVISYELADLQYAPEIAPGMLVRQQAQALIEARHTIVEGAVQIVSSAIERLAENNLTLGDSERARLVSNLLAVICGDARVTPTFSISQDKEDEKAEEKETHRNQLMTLLEKIAINTTQKT